MALVIGSGINQHHIPRHFYQGCTQHGPFNWWNAMKPSGVKSDFVDHPLQSLASIG